MLFKRRDLGTRVTSLSHTPPGPGTNAELDLSMNEEVRVQGLVTLDSLVPGLWVLF